jgi:hypothetical protein
MNFPKMRKSKRYTEIPEKMCFLTQILTKTGGGDRWSMLKEGGQREK